MKAYDDVRTTNPDNVFSSDIISAFDKAIAYDDMRESIIGLRNSAWAWRHSDSFSHSLIYKVTNGLLTDDKDLLGIMVQFPIIAVTATE